MKLTDTEKAVLVLTTRLGDSSRPSYPPGGWAKLSQQVRDGGHEIADVFRDLDNMPTSDDDRARITRLLSDAPAVLIEAEQLSQRGIWTCTVESDGYPLQLSRRLGDARPSVVFGVGDRTLLQRGGVGIVGSRNVDPEGAEVAKDMARAAVRLQLPVVSGAARGVDQLAMDAAYSAGGLVVGVLADALSRRIRSSETLAALDAESLCLITQQHPNAGFSAGAAMARNKLVYALADLTIVIATDKDTGGTWAGATEALSKRYGTVAVWRGVGEGPGNAALERLGAVPIRHPDDLDDLLKAEPTPAPEQLSFIE